LGSIGLTCGSEQIGESEGVVEKVWKTSEFGSIWRMVRNLFEFRVWIGFVVVKWIVMER
jgi:hypothetical protein